MHTNKKYSVSLWTLLLLLMAQPVRGQYSLDETGISFGAGPVIAAGETTHLGPGYNAHFFFTHYVCGKRWGFHFEGGYRGLMTKAIGIYTPFEDPILPEPTLSIHFAELGAYYKIRPHTYHREKESAFLFGPKLSLGGFYGVSDNRRDIFLMRDGKVPFFHPGMHVSYFLRRPVGDEQSFFIRPGAEIYFSPLYKVNTYSYLQYYFFLNLGFTLWRSH